MIRPLRRTLSRLRLGRNALIELLYPTLCPICDSRLSHGNEAAICASCALELHHYEPELHRGDERLYSCPLFRQLYALYTYQKGCAVQRLIHAIKYHGYGSLARYLGRAALYTLDWEAKGYDFVLAVPLERTRLRQRGYNQSLIMAQTIAQNLGIGASDRLIGRHHGSHTQTSLSRIERMDNMKHAFFLTQSAPKALQGKHVLLVDDVLTTGSTLTEMCYLLERAGVASIDVFVAAVAI